ncbi:DUF1990 family protein [Desertivibrio insolitus]|uniref:DUF1990 family protein n=1 Tax=Herbiconiux sp. SYSU D00978 TaxID=2812562 RepID=UPI001A975E63|nr:DUF1990 domain-containing protein [Herbiconiux sp. SYSU D00978]
MTETPLWERPVSYGAVGATKAPDLLGYPPAGYRPGIASARIGHGDARWEWATTAVLTWEVQRRSDLRVEVVEPPAAVTEGTYSPVGFDEEGTPVEPAVVDAAPTQYGPNGERLAVPGDTAVLQGRLGPLPVHGAVRVIYVLDEADERGFAYGTLAGHPVHAEYAFLVTRRPDGSVWLEVRSVWRPSNAFWALATPVLALAHRIAVQRFLRALTGPIPS